MNVRSWCVGLMLLSCAAAGRGHAEELAQNGGPAPMFRLPVYNPKPVGATVVGLDRYVGADACDKNARLVLLSFMASYCEPCKKEMPWLQQLHEKLGPKGLRVVMVSIDAEPEGQKIISELIAKNGVTFPVLKDRFNLVARRWLGAQSPLPSVFLVKPDGTVATSHKGYSEDIAKSLDAEIAAVLAPEVKTAVQSGP
jgi:thiol-disulfide isomerase/thioredoxin